MLLFARKISLRLPAFIIEALKLNAGTATVTVTGKGDTAGTATATFTIKKATLSVSSTAVKAALDATSKAPVEGAATAVTYKSSKSDVATVAADGTISYKKVGVAKIVATVADAENYEVASVSFKVTVMPKTPEVTANGGNDKVRVKASLEDVTGYQVVVVGKGITKKVNVNTTEDLNKVVTGLTKAGTYKVKVRGYNKISSKTTIYGAFSAVQKVAVK